MIFRQFFDSISSTYTYLIASRKGGEALIIDPVLEKTDHYIKLLDQLELRLVKVIDTHIHADHISGIAELRDRTKCVTLMGEQAPADVVSMHVKDNEKVKIEGIELTALYTPGHTDDSYSFLMKKRVFTGDTLLIRGTGRTDFQNGSPYDQYHSLFDRLLKLPEETFIHPAHDYKGDLVSTIGEERKFNPRLQVTSAEEYAQIMNNLILDNPKMMDVAVPTNKKLGMSLDQQKKFNGLSVFEAKTIINKQDCCLIDLRENSEIERQGSIDGSIQVSFNKLPDYLHKKRQDLSKSKLVFYCAVGERSTLAVQLCQSYNFTNVNHLIGGINKWREEEKVV